MTTPELPRSPREIQEQNRQFDLNPFRERFYQIQNEKAEYEQAKARWERSRNRLKASVGQADELVLDGVVVATHAISGGFNSAKLRDEQPDIYQDYLVEVTTQVFDEDRFAKDHPGLYASDVYRARALRFKI